MKEILIIKPSSLGDVVHTLPAVRLVRRAFPKAKLRWLVNPEWKPILEGNPDLDEIILFPRRELGGIHRIGAQWHWLKTMRAQYRSDLVLDFQGLLRSAWIGRVCRGKRFLGLADAREGATFFYDDKVAVSGPQVHRRWGGTAHPLHAVERYLQLPAALGQRLKGEPEWPLPFGTRPLRFDPQPPYLLLHPFSRGKGKSLTVDEVERFCRAIPYRVVLAGRTTEITGPLDRLDHVENLLNHTTLPELIWLLRHAHGVISVDSGPMHLAAALGKPLVSIHTWSDPLKVGPYDPMAWVWQNKQLYEMSQAGQRHLKPQTLPDMESLACWWRETYPL